MNNHIKNRFIFSGYDDQSSDYNDLNNEQSCSNSNHQELIESGRLASDFYREQIAKRQSNDLLFNPTLKRIEMYEAKLQNQTRTTTTVAAAAAAAAAAATTTTIEINNSDSNVKDIKDIMIHFYHCESCNIDVSIDLKQEHITSTVHLLASNVIGTPKNHFHISQRNRGYKLLTEKYGWDEEQGGLGKDNQGRLYPLSTSLKHDKSGIGNPTSKLKVTHTAHDISMSKQSSKTRAGRSGGRRTKKSKKLKQQQQQQEKSKKIQSFNQL
ncbi:hypothetical protein PPL_00611 [Heterostelium album PN500]|uniref:G-patch domain-containing protein n=1 Tax=Heterostelium pallidum (strain ATCC 26659 / Pp 5 / PN500) TaxID=670386 RepID=D3AWY3_HETP5|nr:hypothetical protein PPL_00611 [Heterostelium album PN500]EFA86806.1 hypothetical protein PPL_00611 [Heterostelium album PN500]|eukprot:XP_020438909.1 hypothetical protein PPL_00611 [Heterostelium album PN500]